MRIGIQPRPKKCKQWPQIKAWLEPAAKLGGVPVLERYEVVWTVVDEGEIIAAATARILPDDKVGEIVLVGGKDRKRWLGHLDWLIGCWLRMEGMKAVRAYGRAGWQKELIAQGWRVIGKDSKVVAYERPL